MLTSTPPPPAKLGLKLVYISLEIWSILMTFAMYTAHEIRVTHCAA